MSHASLNDPPDNALPGPPAEPPGKPSYKKKYLKKRHAFKERMRESNTLFEDEHRSIEIANRLQEQNDQLLDLLLDLNESNRIPSPLRYTLSPTPSASAVPSLEPDDPIPPSHLSQVRSASANLHEAHVLFSRGQISPARYNEISARLDSILHNPTPLSSLFAQTPHTTHNLITPDQLQHDFAPTDTIYLTAAHEDAYLNTLDAAIASSHHDLEATFAALKKESAPSAKDNHKDLSIRNPVSAYNWLRKYKPELFASIHLNDAGILEHAQERKPKASPKPNTSHAGGTRGSAAKRERKSEVNPKVEPEMLDEDGNVIGGSLEAAAVAATGRGGKRKRGDDDAYRPKGGSSRPGKRKRAGTGGGRGRGSGGGEAEEGGVS